MDIRKHLGEQIRFHRERAGLTQTGLAQELKISPITVNRIEQGHQWPGYENLAAIAKRLDVETSDLFAGVAAPQIEPTPTEALEVLRRAIENPARSAIPGPSVPADVQDLLGQVAEEDWSLVKSALSGLLSVATPSAAKKKGDAS